MSITIGCKSKSGLITALKQASWRNQETVYIECGTFKIKLRNPQFGEASYGYNCPTSPWEQCIRMAREKAIDRLIKRIRKKPKSLFKVT